MLQVRAVERLGIEEDGHGVSERDAVLRRVGLGLSRVPLERAFSIYEMRETRCSALLHTRVPAHTESYAAKGMAAGCGTAVLAAGSMRALLFGVTLADPSTYAVVCGVLLTASALGAYWPISRATRVDPVLALRRE